ncbi:MAG: AAA family ATPase [Rhodothermales bacterium]|nr:AAA family ATPase [Rhodothermales bacterium]MBO6778558.1 AAA family ATPase [Rhodothermales bacterium]
MSSRFQDRLNRAAGRDFVGRGEEMAAFRRMLVEPEPEHLVLMVHGPGGIGKSTLLKAFARLCGETGGRALLLDARDFGDSAPAFLKSVCQRLEATNDCDVWAALGAVEERVALLIDTFELAADMEPWLVREFLPRLPDNVVVALAGRHGPSDAWRREPGWNSLMRALPLRNLKLVEAAEMLHRAGVPEDRVHALLAPTHGHPLAVALVLELYQLKGGVDVDPTDAPDIVRALVERLVMKVPSPAHRLALEACAITHAMTEDLLAAMLDAPEAGETFLWLRGLAFIEASESGLTMHDVAREALAADLRWRNPGQYRELHRRARRYYVAAMHGTSDKGLQRRHLRDLVYLHRDNPLVQPLYQQLRAGHGRAEAHSDTRIADADAQAVREMVTRHEGPEAGTFAASWIQEASSEELVIFRDGAGVPNGLLFLLDLETHPDALRAEDPCMSAASEYLKRTAPLRPGERATVFRFWMAADEYQGLSYVQMAIFVHMVQHYLTTPSLAFSFLPSGIADDLEPIMAYGDIHRLPVTYRQGGRDFGMFGHDWRVVPPDAWLELMGQRQEGASVAESRPPVRETLHILDRSDFAEALKQALQHYARPERMPGNPLLRSSLVATRAPGPDEADRIETLRQLIADAAGGLSGLPKLERAYQALDRTYLRPAGSQEAAAEMTGMAYSTFRRQLARAVDEVGETLWRMEIGD